MRIVESIRAQGDKLYVTVCCTCGESYEAEYSHSMLVSEFPPPEHGNCLMWPSGPRQLAREVDDMLSEESEQGANRGPQ